MRNLMIALSMFASVAVATPAFADVPPPNTADCQTKAAGDACTDDNGASGICSSSTCTKLDYSDGSPPGTITYDCLICTSDGSSSSSGTSSSSSGGSSHEEAGCSVRNGGVAGALGAWILGAAVLMLARRTRTRGRKPRS